MKITKMELLTKENKEQFKKWLNTNKFEDLVLYERIFEDFFFEELPFEMQIGVYLAYYKEVHSILIIATIDNIKEQLIHFNDEINN